MLPAQPSAHARRRPRQPSASAPHRDASAFDASWRASAAPSVEQLFEEARRAGLLRTSITELANASQHRHHEAAALKTRILLAREHEQHERAATGSALSLQLYARSAHSLCDQQVGFAPSVDHVCDAETCVLEAFVVDQQFTCPVPDEHPPLALRADGTIEHRATGDVFVCRSTGRVHVCNAAACEYQVDHDGCLSCPLTWRDLGGCAYNVTEYADGRAFDSGKPMTQLVIDEVDFSERRRVAEAYEQKRPDNVGAVKREHDGQVRERSDVLLLEARQAHATASAAIEAPVRRLALPAPDGLGAAASRAPQYLALVRATRSPTLTAAAGGGGGGGVNGVQSCSASAPPRLQLTAPPSPAVTERALVAVGASAKHRTVEQQQLAPARKRSRASAAVANDADAGLPPLVTTVPTPPGGDAQVRACFEQHLVRWFNALEAAYSLPGRLRELLDAEREAARRIAERARASARVRAQTASGGGVPAEHLARTASGGTVDYCDAYERFGDAAEYALQGLTHVQLAGQWSHWSSGALRRERIAALVSRMCAVWNVLVQTPEFRASPQPFLYRTIGPAIRDTAIGGLSMPVCRRVTDQYDAVYTACVLAVGEECAHEARTVTFVARDATLHELLEAPGIRERVRRTLDEPTLSQCNRLVRLYVSLLNRGIHLVDLPQCCVRYS
jgi:hypothetical protein